MINVLNQYIKEVIAAHPDVAELLAGFKIGCTTCSLGTCKLKDVVDMHDLSEDDESSLYKGIASIVYPNQQVTLPKPRERKPVKTSKKMAPPLMTLVGEHAYIKKVIAAIPRLSEELETTLAQKQETIKKVIDFIKNYADRYHHAKEEDLVFKLFDQSAEILSTMFAEHDAGRGYVRAIVKGLEDCDAGAIVTNLNKYGQLLSAHIKKEDEILYPWINRNLSDRDVGKLFFQFAEVEVRFGDAPREYEAFADSLG